MRKVCSGKMTLGQISGEVIYYIGQGVEKVVVKIAKNKHGQFVAEIFVGGKHESPAYKR